MELGGNAPFLVFGDADVDAAVDGAMLAKMRNIGEACTAANRFIVHDSVGRRVHREARGPHGALKVGRGTEDGVDVGPLVEKKQRDKVSDLVDDAVSAGGDVVTGGSAPERDGWYYTPTVLSNVPQTARVFREEIFGPVAPVFGFSDDEQAVAMANDTEYGLVAYVYARDVSRAPPGVREPRDRDGRAQPGHRVQPGRHRSVASRPPGSVVRAGPRASRSTSRRSTSALPCNSRTKRSAA
jgi:succinate-semialdehyde dehydrogenase/glutarate-semialdehyde dehydrogenase